MPNFVKINHSFLCKNCGHENPQHTGGSCRNHCRHCLYSAHLDHKDPGDRSSNCHGLMPPIGIEYTGKKGFLIAHQCCLCQKTISNKTAPDDNFDRIVELSTLSTIESSHYRNL